MANLQERAGSVNIRLGGNSQDSATLVDSSLLQPGVSLQTSPVEFTKDFLYLMSNISSIVNVRWYLGIPFNTTTPFRLGIAEYGQVILGQNLLGLEVGNQPDEYTAQGLRPFNYTPANYIAEFGQLVGALGTTPLPSDLSGLNPNVRNQQILLGPSVASGPWSPDLVWNAGFVTSFSPNLAALSVHKYPTNNCGSNINWTAQSLFPLYLNHSFPQSIVAQYSNSSWIAQGAGKPLLMLETNTAACGGFPGLSDSFGAALWALDYALQMAYGNFSGAHFHVNGQNSAYNAFTPAPPTDFSNANWTVGPIYYSALAMAETLGSSNMSQVVDLQANFGSIYTPAYAIYEKGFVARVALFNYMTDPSGANAYTANIAVSDIAGVPATPNLVQVKYLQSASVSDKSGFTWAGQTLGKSQQADGTLQGQEVTQTVQCANGFCSVKVPAPGFALVFMNAQALNESTSGPTTTFATTVSRIMQTTLSVNPSVLATSNGRRRPIDGHLGSTSKGKLLGGGVGMTRTSLPSIMVLLAVVSGVLLIGRPR